MFFMHAPPCRPDRQHLRRDLCRPFRALFPPFRNPGFRPLRGLHPGLFCFALSALWNVLFCAFGAESGVGPRRRMRAAANCTGGEAVSNSPQPSAERAAQKSSGRNPAPKARHRKARAATQRRKRGTEKPEPQLSAESAAQISPGRKPREKDSKSRHAPDVGTNSSIP